MDLRNLILLSVCVCVCCVYLCACVREYNIGHRSRSNVTKNMKTTVLDLNFEPEVVDFWLVKMFLIKIRAAMTYHFCVT